MKNSVVCTLLVGLLLPLAAPLQAQQETLTYFLYANKGKVGKWVVSRYREADQTVYESRREVIFKVIKSIRTVTTQRAIYRDDRLQSFDMSVTVNGEPRKSTHIERKGNRYRYEVEGQQPRWLDAPVVFSHIRLFFEPPGGQKELLVERLGDWLPVRKLDDHSYALTLPNGEENKYFYLDGRLTRATLEDGLLHTYVRLKRTKVEDKKRSPSKS